jgi:hypothetical protein
MRGAIKTQARAFNAGFGLQIILNRTLTRRFLCFCCNSREDKYSLWVRGSGSPFSAINAALKSSCHKVIGDMKTAVEALSARRTQLIFFRDRQARGPFAAHVHA